MHWHFIDVFDYSASTYRFIELKHFLICCGGNRIERTLHVEESCKKLVIKLWSPNTEPTKGTSVVSLTEGVRCFIQIKHGNQL